MANNLEHKDIPVEENHSPFRWEVLTTEELSTIEPDGVKDVRKVAFVVDDGTGNPTAYVLTKFTPTIEWKPLVSVIGGGGSVVWGGITGTVANQADLVAYLQANYQPANVNIQSHITSTSNPHSTTAAQVGLSNVDNTSDADKPVSSAVQIEFDETNQKITDMNESGFLTWMGSGNYWSSNEGAGTFTILRGGTGRIGSELITWAGNQTISIPTGVTSYVYIGSNGIIGATTNSNLVYGLTIPLFEVYRTPSGGIFPTKENHPYEFENGASGYLHRIVGTVFESGSFDLVRITTGTGGAITDRQVKIVGNDVLEDHGLRTTISDSGGEAVTKYFPFKNGSGVWDLYATSSEFPMVYNNAGTVTALGANKYGVFRVYAVKDSLNSSTPLWVCVIHNAELANLSAAQDLINQGLAAQPDGEFLKMEVCQVGYILVQNSGGGYINSITMDRRTLRTGTTGGTISNLAVNHIVDASGFSGNLSATDTNVQIALQTLDDLVIPTVLSAKTVQSTTANTVSTESVTMINLPELTVTLEANSTYEIEGFLPLQQSNTNGYALQFVTPSDCQPFYEISPAINAGTSATQGHLYSATAGTVTTTTGSVSAATTTMVPHVKAIIKTVSAGTLNFNFRYNGGATAGTTTILAGATIVWEKIQ